MNPEEPVKKALKERARWLKLQYCECADHNRQRNDVRMKHLALGTGWLLTLILPLLVAAILGILR